MVIKFTDSLANSTAASWWLINKNIQFNNPYVSISQDNNKYEIDLNSRNLNIFGDLKRLPEIVDLVSIEGGGLVVVNNGGRLRQWTQAATIPMA